MDDIEFYYICMRYDYFLLRSNILSLNDLHRLFSISREEIWEEHNKETFFEIFSFATNVVYEVEL